MKTKKLKTIALSLMAALVLTTYAITDAVAQNATHLISVNDTDLEHKIKKQADNVLKNKDWDIKKLRENIKDLKSTSRVSASLPKASTVLLSSEDIYEKRSEGVILVGTYYNCGKCTKMHSGLASGAVLTEDGICVTNYHVLDGIIEGTKKSLTNDSLAIISTIDGDIFPITDILAYSKAGDVAIFKIDTRGEEFSPIPLGEPAKTGSKVHAITHPSGRHYYYSEGVVARNVNNGNHGADGDRMEITADYAKGSSGGPILDSYGNLVGMVSTTSSIYYTEQKNLQMVIKSTIPVRTIKKLFR